MLIEVVHINGQYSSDSQSHTQLEEMSPSYYGDLCLVLQRAIKSGASVIYRPNLMSIKSNPDELALAIQSDPFLSVFHNKSALVIQPDFAGRNYQPAHYVIEEDKLLRQHGTAVILGAYTKWCVSAIAHNLMSRNPGYRIGIDMALSVDNGAKYVRPELASIPRFSLRRMLGAIKVDPATAEMNGSKRPNKSSSKLALPRSMALGK